MYQIKLYSAKDLQEGIDQGQRVLQALDSYPLSVHPGFLRVLANSMGHEPYLFVGCVDDKPVNFLALALVKGPIFGRFLVSLPYLNYGGVIGEQGPLADELWAEAKELAVQLKVRHLELRNAEAADLPGFQAMDGAKLNALLPLQDSSDKVWDTLKGTVRNRVRKAGKHGLTGQEEGPKALDEFYEIFAVNMRDLGTPVYPKSLFAEMLREFPEHIDIFTVRNAEGKALAASIVLHGNDVSEVPSVSALREFNALSPNMLLYWEMLKSTVERGHSCFDFGRCTPDSGPHRFKKTWGATLTPAPWRFFGLSGDPQGMRRESPKLKAMIKTWQKLPVGVSKMIGPSIVRGIP